MKAPELPEEHPDRLLDLEQQMALTIQAAMEAARVAGYDIYEIDYAVRQNVANFLAKHKGTVTLHPQLADHGQ